MGVEETVRWPDFGAKPRRRARAEHEKHVGEILDQRDRWTIIRCDDCEFVHTIPIPDGYELAEFYRSAFYEREKPAYIERYEKDRPWWEMTHRHNIAAAGGVLGHRNGKRPRVLDVGTGPGIFLDVAALFEWETHGVEPSSRCTKILRRRGHNIYQGMLEDYFNEIRTGEFDFIHAYEVLEHVGDPQVFLSMCREFLLPHGLLGIVVPNDYNSLQLKAQEEFDIKDRWWVAPPQHLNYFSPESITKQIAQSGFDILERRGTWPMEMYLFAGYNYIENDKVGRMCHENRMFQEMAIDKSGMWRLQRVQLQQNLLEAIGREIFILARKVE
jgi:2-polyprenyl-3-methyl-5-hydroxy-6-metoxy-1,4-benzoquinol methylase